MTRPSNRRATLKDVAREAGVSLSTVSYVLNNSRQAERISAPTKERVWDVVRRLGYKSNPVGQALQRGYTNQVFLLIVSWDLATSHAATAMAISRAAAARGFELTVHVADDDAGAEEFLHRRMLHNVGGLIVLWDSPAMQRSSLAQLAQEGVPVVDLLPGGGGNISVVTADREDAFFQGTQHLIRLGHTRIGLICDSVTRAKTTVDKVAGFRRALQAAGVPADEAVFENVTEFGFEGGHRGFSRLILRCPDITGVLCINDAMALGAMAAAEALGRQCPRDLSVVGFGDFPEGRHWRPKLTTLTLSASRVAEQAVAVVLNGRTQPLAREFRIPEELVIRESTGSSPAAMRRNG